MRPTKLYSRKYLAKLLLILVIALPVVSLPSTLWAQRLEKGDRYPTGVRPETMVAADFDGDLDIDLAVGHREDSMVIVYSNDGAAHFTATDTIHAFYMRTLFTADLNNDGLGDLMAAKFQGGDYAFWYSNGDGTFDVGLSVHKFGIWPEAMCAADFDGDEITDVGFNNITAGQGIVIKFGLGDGVFAEPMVLIPEIKGSEIGAADFDNDGDVDIVFDSSGMDYTILNNGDGTFGERLPTNTPNDYVIVDLNGDEYPDLFGLGTFSCNGSPNYTLGTPEGTFETRVFVWPDLTAWGGTQQPVVADFDGDGYVDFAICAPDTVDFLVGFNDGHTGFGWAEHSAHHRCAYVGNRGMASGDFDGDGDNDLAVVSTDDSLTVFFSQAAQHSRTVIVPDDIPTIQEAIDQAWPGDMVLVQPGIYTENLDPGGRNITLMSSEFHSAGKSAIASSALSYSSSTVIDGGDSGRVITYDDFEDERSVIAGFTLQHGYAPGYGGAIYCYDTAAPTITHNIIRNNTAAAGGGIFVAAGAADIRNNLIIDNISTVMGGGIFMSGSGGIVSNNTICGNTAETGGGGMFYTYGSTTMRNNIFWNNNSTSNGQQIDTASSAPVITYSDIQGGWPGEGNMDTDPMFCDTAGADWHLMSAACGDAENSPCIDAGDPSIADAILSCERGRGAERSDMGAYGGGEVSVGCCLPPSIGDVDQSGMVDITDLQRLIDNQFLTLEPLVCEAEADIDFSESIDITDLQWLLDHQFLSLDPLPPCP